MSALLSNLVIFIGPGGRQFPCLQGLLHDRELKSEKLATSILQDLPTYKQMAKAACTLAVPDAANHVCAAIEASLTPP